MPLSCSRLLDIYELFLQRDEVVHRMASGTRDEVATHYILVYNFINILAIPRSDFNGRFKRALRFQIFFFLFYFWRLK